MIEIKHHFPLKPLNTFGISAIAHTYCSITTVQQLEDTLGYFHNESTFILGSGSNMLILKDIKRPILHINIKGITTQPFSDTQVLLTAMAGENWHELVQYCVKNNLAGIENLALIPGNTGTSPIQNIGAYGVELKDVFHCCEVMDLKTKKKHVLYKTDCNFGYRDSIFKNDALGKFAIISVTLELTDLNETSSYRLKTSYGAISEEMERLEGEPSIAKVAQAVINIRTSKLPDPNVIGNSGSFFKNPIITKEEYKKLLQSVPQMPCYPIDDVSVKIPAGWLIDQSGFKGKRYGDAGVHDRQALVLVNHGMATGEEILAVAREIQQTVLDKFKIAIETEVNLIEN